MLCFCRNSSGAWESLFHGNPTLFLWLSTVLLHIPTSARRVGKEGCAHSLCALRSRCVAPVANPRQVRQPGSLSPHRQFSQKNDGFGLLTDNLPGKPSKLGVHAYCWAALRDDILSAARLSVSLPLPTVCTPPPTVGHMSVTVF